MVNTVSLFSLRAPAHSVLALSLIAAWAPGFATPTNGGFISGTLIPDTYSNGRVATIPGISIGGSSVDNDTFTVTGAGTRVNFWSDIIVGHYGTGVMNIVNGGAVTGTSAGIGTGGAASSGTVTVKGANSLWRNAADLTVGSTGTLNILDGGKVVAQSLNVILGGAIKLDGGTLEVATSSVIGQSATFNWVKGTLSYSGDAAGLLARNVELAVGKTFEVAGELTIQAGQTLSFQGGQLSTSSMRVDGGSFITVGALDLTQTGPLAIVNGGVVKSALGYVGYNAGSDVTVNVAGPGSQWQNTDALFVGASGTGTLNITKGGLVRNTFGFVGINSGSQGTVNVTGTGSQWQNTDDIYIGWDGDGHLNIEDGGVVTNTSAEIGAGVGHTGTVTVTGYYSIWRNAADLTVGVSGRGILNLVDGGHVTAKTLTVGAQGSVNIDWGFVNVDRLILNGGSLTASNYATEIRSQVTNNGKVDATSAFLNFSAAVDGAGSYAGDVAFGGAFTPGNDNGSGATVEFNGGNVTITSILTMDIFGSEAGTQYDQLVGINSLGFDGQLILVFGHGYVPLPGSSFALFGFNAFYGTFGTAADGYNRITVVGYDRSLLDFSHLATDGKLSLAADATTAAPVPEPASWALSLAGLALVGGVACHRRAAALI
jgi:T5SS/PEP-CTERM-associated repeat protein